MSNFDFLEFHDVLEQPPALIVGRNYWNIFAEEFFLFVSTNGGEYEFDTIPNTLSWFISLGDVNNQIDFNVDWWAECAVGMWFNGCEREGHGVGPHQVTTEWPHRDSTYGKEFESATRNLYPSREEAEEADRG